MAKNKHSMVLMLIQSGGNSNSEKLDEYDIIGLPLHTDVKQQMNKKKM